jgi:hypothetical protein
MKSLLSVRRMRERIHIHQLDEWIIKGIYFIEDAADFVVIKIPKGSSYCDKYRPGQDRPGPRTIWICRVKSTFTLRSA